MTKRPTRAKGLHLSPIKLTLDGSNAINKTDPMVIRTLHCRTIAKGRFQQLNYIRELPPQPMIKDTAEGLLSEDVAPNASEALLAAFGTCLAVGTLANAIARHIPIRRLELNLEADLHITAVGEPAKATQSRLASRPCAFRSNWMQTRLPKRSRL